MKLPRVMDDLREPAILLAAAALGIGVSLGWPRVKQSAELLIVPLLVLVLFSLFARVSLCRLRDAARDRRYVLTALGLNFLSTPLLAFALGWLFLRDYPALWVGLVLALSTPCTDWYLIFTQLAGGDVHRNLALLPWNLMLQLVLLPLYLWGLTSTLVPVYLDAVAQTFALYVAIPLVAGQLLRWKRPSAVTSLWLSQLGFIALALTVAAMFASHGDLVVAEPMVFLRMAPPMLSFYLLSFGNAWGMARWLRFPREQFVALACTTTARNSPLALPLAVVLFPAQPVIALSQLIEPVLEIPSLIIFAALLKRRARSAKAPDASAPHEPLILWDASDSQG
jgi:ACR3 family arsenite transporter